MTELPEALQLLMARDPGVASWATTLGVFLGAFLGAWLMSLRGQKIDAETEQVRQDTAKIAAMTSRETVEDLSEQIELYRHRIEESERLAEKLGACRRECIEIEERAASADRRAARAELRVIALEARCRAIEELARRIGIDLAGMLGEAS